MIASRFLKALSAAMLAMIVPVLTIAPVAAAPTPQAAIATRQAGYKKMGAAMKALNDQLKSDAPAKAVMLDAARTIAATAPEQPKLFPAGSGASAGVKTDALPSIWTDRATFDSKMRQLLTESAKLVTVVNGGDVAAIRAQAKATGATCAGCHRQFRADN
ncbi:Cytochrome c556 [Sphingomonas sp. YR710]|uniref:c-type cytochrome n=1 Tax=Sphingomonas sp. YR710 TaxID=1882773 RepID=UPI00088D2E25|nr:cytochrome c [Sphingomonas sp. YR710]SDC27868.1 Cytochrome c556 [Sphingomonas sp. YR710]